MHGDPRDLGLLSEEFELVDDAESGEDAGTTLMLSTAAGERSDDQDTAQPDNPEGDPGLVPGSRDPSAGPDPAEELTVLGESSGNTPGDAPAFSGLERG